MASVPRGKESGGCTSRRVPRQQEILPFPGVHIFPVNSDRDFLRQGSCSFARNGAGKSTGAAGYGLRHVWSSDRCLPDVAAEASAGLFVCIVRGQTDFDLDELLHTLACRQTAGMAGGGSGLARLAATGCTRIRGAAPAFGFDPSATGPCCGRPSSRSPSRWRRSMRR